MFLNRRYSAEKENYTENQGCIYSFGFKLFKKSVFSCHWNLLYEIVKWKLFEIHAANKATLNVGQLEGLFRKQTVVTCLKNAIRWHINKHIGDILSFSQNNVRKSPKII